VARRGQLDGFETEKSLEKVATAFSLINRDYVVRLDADRNANDVALSVRKALASKLSDIC